MRLEAMTTAVNAPGQRCSKSCPPASSGSRGSSATVAGNTSAGPPRLTPSRAASYSASTEPRTATPRISKRLGCFPTIWKLRRASSGAYGRYSRIFHRTRISASLRSAGSVSNCIKATRTDTSGISSPSLPPPLPTLSQTSDLHLPSHQDFRFVAIGGKRFKLHQGHTHRHVRNQQPQPAASIAHPFTDFGNDLADYGGVGKIGFIWGWHERSHRKLTYSHTLHLPLGGTQACSRHKSRLQIQSERRRHEGSRMLVTAKADASFQSIEDH